MVGQQFLLDFPCNATNIQAATPPPRVAARPDPTLWGKDELLTLPEAASLYWPQGPLTVRTLRTAVRDGVLAATWIAGKLFTSPGAIDEMTKPRVARSSVANDRDGLAASPADDVITFDGALKAPSAEARALREQIAAEKRRLRAKANRGAIR